MSSPVGRVADLERLDGRHELLEQPVVDLRARHHARGGGAVLARVPVAADLDRLGDRGRVGVVEDDHGRLAAELEVDALEGVRGGAGDLLAGRDVAGERDEPHVRVPDDARADRLAVAGDHVQDAGREITSAASCANRSVVSGVCSDGLSTTTFPAASAGAIFQTAIISG